jgi:hypothetical protein
VVWQHTTSQTRALATANAEYYQPPARNWTKAVQPFIIPRLYHAQNTCSRNEDIDTKKQTQNRHYNSKRSTSRSDLVQNQYFRQTNGRKVINLTIGLNGKFLCSQRDGVCIRYTVICLSHFDVCLAIT